MKGDRGVKSSLLFITRKWPPAMGGMETYSVELTTELARHLPVTTLALPGRSDGSPPGALALILFAIKTAWRYLRLSRPPEILHIGDMACWPLGLLARFRRPRPIVILSAHGTDVSFHRRGGMKGGLYGLYLRLGARLLPGARVIANSAATAAVAAESGWRDAVVVPLATRISASEPPATHGDDLLFAGRLIHQKGCLWFVDNVLPMLPPHISLKIAGTIRDEAERAVLDDPRVTYLGSLAPDLLAEAYRKALCVIVPNIELASGEYEGFGLVAVEASAAGGIVLASATGGLVDAVMDGQTGFALPPGDPQAWRNKIVEIAGWPDDERRDFLERAMMRSQDVYSWPRVADDVLKVYDDELAMRRLVVPAAMAGHGGGAP